MNHHRHKRRNKNKDLIANARNILRLSSEDTAAEIQAQEPALKHREKVFLLFVFDLFLLRLIVSQN